MDSSDELRELARATGAPVLCVDHTSECGSVREVADTNTPDRTDNLAEALDRLARSVDRLAEALDRAAPAPEPAPKRRSPW